MIGSWTYQYDDLNRLVGATANQVNNPDTHYCWAYDAFGNRTLQAGSSAAFTAGSPACTPSGTSSYNGTWAHYITANNNRLANTNQAMAGVGYDAAGEVINDGVNQYLYDGDGRVCAVSSSQITGGPILTGYVYNAAGQRVSKGTITNWSCDPAISGFTAMNDYVLGLGGEQVTEMAANASKAMVWQHTNVYAAGALFATYDDNGLHFHLNDWQGTRRVQTDYAGVMEQTCSSLPFGDTLNCSNSIQFPTEHHFTGKERDTESGLDYFGARYYGSSMGRWMSPDPSNLGVDIYLPQTWNKYNYAVNNPLTIKDANGLWPFYIHNQIIDESLPGLSKQELQGLKSASWNMDFGKGQQDPANSYEHGMSDGTTNQGPMVAQQMGDNYISQQVQTAQQAQADWEAQGHTGIAPNALTAFGNALHTATDRTSPSHRGNQPWHNDPWYNKRTRTHVEGEATINAAQRAAARNAAQQLFRRTFGNQFPGAFQKEPCFSTSASDNHGNSTGSSGCQ